MADHWLHPPSDRDVQTCQACGFPGVPLPFEPAPTTDPIVTQTGTIYYPVPGEPITVRDKRTRVEVPPGTCPFCGTNRPQDGKITW